MKMKPSFKKSKKSSNPKSKFSKIDKNRLLVKKKKSFKKKIKIDDLSGCGYEVCFEKNWFTDAPKCGHGKVLIYFDIFS